MTVSALAVATGFLEAFQLYLVSQVAFAVARRGGPVSIVAGPLDWHPTVAQALLAALASTAVWMLLGAIAGRLQARAATRTLVGMQTRLTSSFLAASHEMHAAESEGQLQELISNGPSVALMVMHVCMGVFGMTNCVILVVAAMVISPLAALVLIAGMGMLVTVLMPFSRQTRGLSRSRIQTTIDLSDGIGEMVSTAREVQLFDVGGPVMSRLRGRIEAAARPYFKIKFLSRLVPVLYQGASVALVVGGLGAINAVGGNDAGQLSGVILLLVRATMLGAVVQSALQSLSDVVPVSRRIDDQERFYRQGAVETGNERIDRIETLELDHVSFGYDPEHLVLRDISITIRRGEAVAVVGATGAGKSTLVQILLRLRQPLSGAYRVNGIDATEFDAAVRARLVALAPQDGRLISGTVAENIAFFRSATEPGVLGAAEAVHLQPDLARWPDGLETQVGTRGVAISGGQAQRITLARALVGNPDLLVLDEPTSSVDVDTERAIVDTLRTLKGRTTLVVIAHRQSTISMCDRVLEVGGGVVLDRPATRI